MYNLTPEKLESFASNSSITYGELCYANGRVSEVKITNDKFIEANVYGQRKYQIFIEYNQGVNSSWCSCAYDRDNFCKHRVAALFAVMSSNKSYVKVSKNPAWEKYLRVLYRFKKAMYFKRN
ncbi:MAG: SWIM zinc finger family protein [Calditrichaeota bacterium]|nr:SWIM zinc finger family protein [Calditrichota bacterium]